MRAGCDSCSRAMAPPHLSLVSRQGLGQLHAPSAPPSGREACLQPSSPAAGTWAHCLLWFQVYVQDLLQQRLAGEVLRVLHEEQGHLYVCGDVRMARDVACTLKQLVATALTLNEEQVEDYFFQLKVEPLVWGLGVQVKGMGLGARPGASGPGESASEQPRTPRNPRGSQRLELVRLLEALSMCSALIA